VKPGQKVIEDRKDYALVYFPRRLLTTRRRKPGTVWNWHGSVPWWGDRNQTIRCDPVCFVRRINRALTAP
jgi:hypothetical protein